jgi:uncharacterized membrane protein YbhN (UPF0104 family)
MKKLPDWPILRWAKTHKKALGIATLILTAVLLTWYVISHPDIITKIKDIPPGTLALLFVLYAGILFVNVGITYAVIKMCRKDLSLRNNLYLTAYSSLINFFGPLQSGPGVRAAYLKTKIGLGIRQFTLGMLFYYFAFAAINTSLIFVAKAPYLTAVGLLASIALIAFGTARFKFLDRWQYITFTYLITCVQVLLTAIIYHTELHATGTPASFTQSLSYSGSANLSLFVSLTPGAIGIREAFLLFTQNLHGIQTSSIVAAGIVDRAFYILFLIVLFLITSLFHVKDTIVSKRRS